MSHSDAVRDYCGNAYVAPARAAGRSEIKIRAGDVHKALGYSNRMPLVCSAIGSKKFEDQFGAKRTSIEGPSASTTTTYTFRLS